MLEYEKKIKLSMKGKSNNARQLFEKNIHALFDTKKNVILSNIEETVYKYQKDRIRTISTTGINYYYKTYIINII